MDCNYRSFPYWILFACSFDFAKEVSVTKEERAAEAHESAHYFNRDQRLSFLAGIKWRDQNPSEAVLALVKAAENADCPCIYHHGDDCVNRPLAEALAQWKRERGEGPL